MKFIVDKMPETGEECPFSEWHPYPPIMEEVGAWYCKHDDKKCNLCGTECRWMKEQFINSDTIESTITST